MIFFFFLIFIYVFIRLDLSGRNKHLSVIVQVWIHRGNLKGLITLC